MAAGHGMLGLTLAPATAEAIADLITGNEIGDSELLRLRAKVRARLGADFDVRKFHRAVLGPGGMPFPLLEWHIDRTFEAHVNTPLQGEAHVATLADPTPHVPGPG
ncbi:DUF885 family protein [Nonomuraea insulae]|uniref:DUF885 family protein n=1 Tax=Nonomuraea insulae TaxID=1616787 RepID=A0ABW1D5N5_9ACTN